MLPLSLSQRVCTVFGKFLQHGNKFAATLGIRTLSLIARWSSTFFILLFWVHFAFWFRSSNRKIWNEITKWSQIVETGFCGLMFYCNAVLLFVFHLCAPSVSLALVFFFVRGGFLPFLLELELQGSSSSSQRIATASQRISAPSLLPRPLLTGRCLPKLVLGKFNPKPLLDFSGRLWSLSNTTGHLLLAARFFPVNGVRLRSQELTYTSNYHKSTSESQRLCVTSLRCGISPF